MESAGRMDTRQLAGEIFAVAELVAAQPRLRRALADPSRETAPKRELARRVLAGQVSEPAMEIVDEVVGGRWTRDQDLTDTLEEIGTDLVFAASERDGQLDRLEDELFEVQGLMARQHDLASAVVQQGAAPQAKAELLHRVLGGRVSGDAVWLADRPVLNPRGRKYGDVLTRQMALAARRRHQMTAVVTSAVELTADQKQRIEAALGRMYGRSVNANVAVDPDLLGGVHIRIGDDVIDGTIVRRLEDAGRALSSTTS